MEELLLIVLLLHSSSLKLSYIFYYLLNSIEQYNQTVYERHRDVYFCINELCGMNGYILYRL